MTLEEILLKIKNWFSTNYRVIYWCVFFVLLCWVLLQVRDVTTLLVFSYVLVLLIDPWLKKLESYGFSRGGVIITMILGGGFIVILLLLIVIPIILRQYSLLITSLPQVIDHVADKIEQILINYKIEFPHERSEVLLELKGYISMLDSERITSIGKAFGQALLSGYSYTLAIINFALFPFFLYYIAADLPKFHRMIQKFIAPQTSTTISSVGEEILGHVRLFFKGQMTVASIMALLYAIGLYFVGLPYALVVGLIAGVLNIVPYLGIVVGVVLSSIIALVYMPGFLNLLLVWGVFVIVQALEGNLLTPKIIGDKMGIHPLGVMLALVVGGNIFGLLGIVLALPGAAACIVLFNRFHPQEDGQTQVN
jgi:predicted PurR-regulated permease PerM